MSADEPDTTGPEEVDLTAAEYALGVLDGPARARAAERVRTDPLFRAEVEAWEKRLAPLSDDVDPMAPAAAVWDRVAQAVAPRSTVVQFPSRTGLPDRAGLWRSIAVVSLAAAAACIALVLVRVPQPAAPAPNSIAQAPGVMVASLAGADGKALFVATLDPARGGVTVIPVGKADAGDRSPELWIIPDGGKPQPVGMIQPQRALTLPASAGVLSSAANKAVLAVSLEPAGGSPTGAPTGPVIATGALTGV